MPTNSHHANLLVGSRESAKGYLHNLSEDLGIRLAGNPDVFILEPETFGIDEAREVRTFAARKAFGEMKIFFISSPLITLEAENALLKTFEDPYPDTYFFLVVQDVGVVIPTLLSRMQVTKLYPSLDEGDEAEKFLDSNIKERMSYAKDFEGDLPRFLDQILTLRRIPVVHKMRLMSTRHAAPSRLILEHLALVLH